MRRANRTAVAAAVVVSELTVTPMLVAACPSCEPANVARALVASDPDRWLFAAAALLPFLLMALLALLLYRIGGPPRAALHRATPEPWRGAP